MTTPRMGEVLVTGAGGLIGRGVVQALLDTGWHVRALHRTGSVEVTSPLLSVIHGDLRDVGQMREAMRGITHIIHLAARKSDEPESEAVNVTGTQHLLDCAKAEGVSLFLHVSTPSAGLRSPGVYGATKAKAEELVRMSGVPAVIVRPSVVYADASSGILGSIFKFLSLPVVPMIGNGSVTFAPIHRDDLSMLLVSLLEEQRAIGGTFDVGGPEVLTFRRMLELCMEATRKRKPILALPVPLAMFIARLTSWLPKPPLTASNVRGATEEVALNLSPLRAIVPYAARTFATGVREIVGDSASVREADVLLRYVLPKTTPSPDEKARFLQACHIHAIDASHLLPDRFLRHPWLLAGLDCVSRLRCPSCALQQKLLIAAAVAEASPRSAQVLLPADRSVVAVLLGLAGAGLKSLGSGCIALVLLIAVPRWKAYAGC